mmetsp:Transcript_14237/g.25848  ORF Transcript_14237/g.25848 Transcript_14237/m.25848 type:complete len:137 (-) Transcript_14237:381-791(-)
MPTKPVHASKKVADDTHAEKVALHRQLCFLKLHPLPVRIRMPKHVELTVPKRPSDKALAFCNDTWDVSVIDAFTKITITGNHHKIHKKAPLQNPSVINVLSSCMSPSTSFEVDFIHSSQREPRVDHLDLFLAREHF